MRAWTSASVRAAAAALGLGSAATARAGCEALPTAEAIGVGGDGTSSPCLFVDVEASGRAYVAFPAVGVSRGVALPRARAELGARTGAAQVRWAVTAARSGGADGYVGVDGESYVPVVQIAEVRYDVPAVGLGAGAGLVDDPYVMTVEPAWSMPELVLPLVTDQGYFERSDVGAFVGFTAPERVAAAVLAVTSGEGAARRERNDGVNVTGVVRVRPPTGGTVAPELAAVARYGSRGIGGATDHRLGATGILRHPLVVAGAEAVFGWGFDGDAVARPFGLSGWVRAGPEAPLVAVGRLDLARDDRTLPDGEEVLGLLAAGVRLPELRGADGAGLEVVAGWQARRFGADARGVGGEALARSDLLFVQLTGRLAVGVGDPAPAPCGRAVADG